MIFCIRNNFGIYHFSPNILFVLKASLARLNLKIPDCCGRVTGSTIQLPSEMVASFARRGPEYLLEHFYDRKSFYRWCLCRQRVPPEACQRPTRAVGRVRPALFGGSGRHSLCSKNSKDSRRSGNCVEQNLQKALHRRGWSLSRNYRILPKNCETDLRKSVANIWSNVNFFLKTYVDQSIFYFSKLSKHQTLFPFLRSRSSRAACSAFK